MTALGRNDRRALTACAILLTAFALVAWLAAGTKSPTYDEPYHAASAWVQLHGHDYRIDAADPPLWQYWASLPNGPNALSADFSGVLWNSIPQQMQLQWKWCVTTLYKTPGNDPDGLIARCRAMMLILGVALGALIAWWSWRIGKAPAAIVATTLFALNPNFLAHAPLMKNDVVFSLAMLGTMYLLWKAGQRLTWPRAVGLGVMCGVMLTTKFTGILGLVIIPLLLLARALLPAPWPMVGRTLLGRPARISAAIVTSLCCAIIGYCMIWAVYGFRFSPTPDPAVRLNMDVLAEMAGNNQDLAQKSQFMLVPSIRWANDHRLLPQAWLAGLLFTYQSTLLRQTYLCGSLSATGWWYYFPFAMLVKTPLATLAAGAGAMLILLARFKQSLRWTVICLALPPLIYLAQAMNSNLNIGVRHVLPVFGPMFIAIGCAAGHALQKWRRPTLAALWLLGIGLAIETLAIYPNFIPYFNAAAGGARGGIYLLGDSNLDWGQDLKLLASWQKEHPQTPLFLSYFGLADPRYYGISYVPLPGGYLYHDGKSAWPSGPCVVAVSATNLQGIMVPPELYAEFYAPLRRRPPSQVLGGTIYLYDFSHLPAP